MNEWLVLLKVIVCLLELPLSDSLVQDCGLRGAQFSAAEKADEINRIIV